jgi:choline-sulfatase
VKRISRFILATVLIAASVCVATSCRSRQLPQKRLNVVLITIDTLRFDRVGRGLTPAIDSVAARGVAFDHVRATAPLTLVSHASLMTGTIPPIHGVRENGGVFDRKRPTLARVFREAGYATAAFVGAYVLNSRFGLDEGFDVYDDAVKRDPSRSEMLEAERRGGDVVDAALSYVGGTSQDVGRTSQVRHPFFLWIHLYDPHAPYDPPGEFLKKANGNAYDGEVAYADAQVARVLAALDAQGLTASTAVVITGDHGEALGEHGEQMHGMLVYDATLRVPLVASARDFGAGVAEPCHTDVAAALLRVAGLGDRIPREMSQAIPGCTPYSESRYPRRAGWHALAATTDLRWKLIASSEHELYDLQNDPRELKNVAADHPNIVQAMSATLAKMQPAGGASGPIAPEAAERLRSLGYVSGSAARATDDAAAPNPAKTIAAWTQFERALGLLQAGKPSDAAAVLKQLSSAHPSAQVFQTTYAQALRESGDPRAAVVVYRNAAQRWPDDAVLFNDLSAAAREAGDVKEARRATEAALALDANGAMALNGLGLLHADAGRSREAADAFERAVKQDPGNASYWTNLGNARRELQDASAADAAYRKALAIDAEYADALNGVGVLLVQSGRAADAVPYFERAVRRDPQLTEARLNLGIAYQESGQREKAAAAYRDVLAKAPAFAKRERAAAADLLKRLRE